MINFSIAIEPIAKARPRFNSRSRRTYTPRNTKSFETLFRVLSHRYRPPMPLDGALHMTVRFFLSRPARSKRKYPLVRPDIDNFLKAVLDSMNEVFFADDGQIVKLEAEKLYGEPRIEVTLKELP